jgi:hypothetical protein
MSRFAQTLLYENSHFSSSLNIQSSASRKSNFAPTTLSEDIILKACHSILKKSHHKAFFWPKLAAASNGLKVLICNVGVGLNWRIHSCSIIVPKSSVVHSSHLLLGRLLGAESCWGAKKPEPGAEEKKTHISAAADVSFWRCLRDLLLRGLRIHSRSGRNSKSFRWLLHAQ